MKIFKTLILILLPIALYCQKFQEIDTSMFTRLLNTFYSKDDGSPLKGHYKILNYMPDEDDRTNYPKFPLKIKRYTLCHFNDEGKLDGQLERYRTEDSIYHLNAVSNFNNGLREGETIHYRQNGDVSIRYTSKIDEQNRRSFKTGVSFTYRVNGQVHYKTTYDEEGNMVEQEINRDNGNLRHHSFYSKISDTVVEVTNNYNEGGGLESIVTKKNDKLAESVFFKNDIITLRNRVDWLKGEGVREEFYEDGTLMLQKVTGKKKPYRINREFSNSGQLILEIPRYNNKINGLLRIFGDSIPKWSVEIPFKNNIVSDYLNVDYDGQEYEIKIDLGNNYKHIILTNEVNGVKGDWHYLIFFRNEENKPIEKLSWGDANEIFVLEQLKYREDFKKKKQ